MAIFVVIGLIVVIGGPFLLNAMVSAHYETRILAGEEDDLLAYETAVVFGAAVRNGYPTTVLRDRLDVAIALFRRGQISHMIMSGDGRTPEYDEPAAMARYAIGRGVPSDAITLDRSGLRTYDTCYRLRDVYGVSEAVLVTQAFHLPRALFTCEALGVQSVGVNADQRTYRSARWYDLREFVAVNVAAWDVVLRRAPQGGLEP